VVVVMVSGGHVWNSFGCCDYEDHFKFRHRSVQQPSHSSGLVDILCPLPDTKML
jgi:hypothetical protein